MENRDPIFRRLVTLLGPLHYVRPNEHGHFGALVRSIVFQQLSGLAAQRIFERVIVAADGRLTPESLADASDAALRAAGLSKAKLAALRDLVAKVLDGVLDLSTMPRRSDEEIVAELVAVRGIGRWTAEMYLMFELRRLDVWPVDDLGVRRGYGLIWDVDPAPAPKALAPLGERFRPYRSIVARYCWKALIFARDESIESLQRALAIRAGEETARPLNLRARRILERVRAIPHGSVRTYGDIDLGAPRLVGRVLAAAPHDVPWHRVVRADGTMPQGRRQRKRLRDENVPMRGDRVDMRAARDLARPSR